MGSNLEVLIKQIEALVHNSHQCPKKIHSDTTTNLCFIMPLMIVMLKCFNFNIGLTNFRTTHYMDFLCMRAFMYLKSCTFAQFCTNISESVTLILL